MSLFDAMARLSAISRHMDAMMMDDDAFFAASSPFASSPFARSRTRSSRSRPRYADGDVDEDEFDRHHPRHRRPRRHASMNGSSSFAIAAANNDDDDYDHNDHNAFADPWSNMMRMMAAPFDPRDPFSLVHDVHREPRAPPRRSTVTIEEITSDDEEADARANATATLTTPTTNTATTSERIDATRNGRERGSAALVHASAQPSPQRVMARVDRSADRRTTPSSPSSFTSHSSITITTSSSSSPSSSSTHRGQHRPVVRRVVHTHTNVDGLTESTSMYSDSATGREGMSLARGWNGCGRQIVRERDADGRERTTQTFHELREEDGDAFDAEWQAQAQRCGFPTRGAVNGSIAPLPSSSTGAPRLTGSTAVPPRPHQQQQQQPRLAAEASERRSSLPPRASRAHTVQRGSSTATLESLPRARDTRNASGSRGSRMNEPIAHAAARASSRANGSAASSALRR